MSYLGWFKCSSSDFPSCFMSSRKSKQSPRFHATSTSYIWTLLYEGNCEKGLLVKSIELLLRLVTASVFHENLTTGLVQTTIHPCTI
jgi:hypothetical protein